MGERKAGWVRQPKPQRARRPSGGGWKQKPAPDDSRCDAITAQGTNAGQRCYMPWSIQFGGRRYCERHHPVRQAECEAWRIYREIAKVEAMGFVVTAARAAGGEG